MSLVVAQLPDRRFAEIISEPADGQGRAARAADCLAPEETQGADRVKLGWNPDRSVMAAEEPLRVEMPRGFSASELRQDIHRLAERHQDSISGNRFAGYSAARGRFRRTGHRAYVMVPSAIAINGTSCGDDSHYSSTSTFYFHK